MTKFKKTSGVLLSCLGFVAAAFFGLLFSISPVSVKTNAQETIASTVYQTDGASVRVFEKMSSGDLNETDKQGIRFHVEMGAGYIYGGQTILNTAETYARGSYKITEGFKTYTLVLPTRLLSGDLTVATDKVMKIDTTEYWFSDNDGNWESVAYIHTIPEKWYTDKLSFRGVICTVAEDGTETVVAQTEVAERSLTLVAKLAYIDTIDENTNYWGSAEKDDMAAPLIEKFVPMYSITYKANGIETTEKVLWGDTPQSVPTGENVKGAWYDTKNNEEVNVTETMNWTENRELVLETTSSEEFVLTGVAAETNHTIKEMTYNGIKVYATLPTTGSAALAYNEKLDIEAVNIEYTGTGTFNGFEGIWTMQEGEYMRLFFAFKEGTQLVGGDKILIKGDSVFYADGIMYKLTQDYTIDYNGADYGMFLGYLHNSDVKSIYNYSENREDANGQAYTKKVIRIEFGRDVLINSDYTFVYEDALPEGAPSPVYLKCGNDGKTTEIAGGYYHWNNGEHKILELNGYGCGFSNDELHGLAGTKVVQNGGYYVFSDNMYAYYNGSAWVNGKSIGSFGISEFAATGENFTDGINEVRINTNSRWWDTATQLTVENMSTTAKHAVYYTSVDGTVTPIPSFIFHGQDFTDANGNATNHQIFGIRETLGIEAGDTITIVNGTRFWGGNEYYTFTDTQDLVLYYNGSYWIVNSDGTPTGTLDSKSFTAQALDYNGDGDGIVKTRLFLTSEIFNTSNLVTVENGGIKIRGMDYDSLGFVVKYHASGNKILEFFKDKNTQAGLNAFTDTIVFEQGTRLWMDSLCYEFTETVTFVYLGETQLAEQVNPNLSIKANWAQSTNTDVTVADVTRIYNEGEEVRIRFASGIITTTYYGIAIIDASKGLPVINGVEASVNGGFTYGMNHNLFGIRNSGYGQNKGDTLVIPAGSVWWTTQGSITFTEEICAIYPADPEDTNWLYSNKNDTNLGIIDVNKITRVYNEGTQVRVKIPLKFSDTYYGYAFLDGEAYVKKANGSTVSAAFSYWYGGQSTDNPGQDHSLIGFGGIIGETNGDQFIIPVGTKLFLLDGNGYHTFSEDIVYTFLDGSWNAGNLIATVKTTAENATVELPETDMFSDKEYTFTATPNSGYVISSVTANGTELSLVDGKYTFTALGGENNIVVTTKKLYTVTVNAGNSTVSGIANGEYADGTTVNFTVTPNTGYNLTSVTGATGSGSNYSVTVNGETTITVNTELKTYTVTLTTTNASVSGVTNTMTITHGQTYNFTAAANSGYGLSSVTINGTEKGTGGSYSFTATGDVTIIVTAKQYTVKLTTTNASVSGVANSMTIAHGQAYNFTAAANSGYGLSSVTINGTEKGTGGSYSFTATGDVTIIVTAKQYTVTYTTSGDITVSAPATVAHNGSVTFNLTLPANATVTVNGNNVGTSYTVNNVTANVSVKFVTWYSVTVNAGNATVSAVSGSTNNGLYESGKEISFTVSDTVSHSVTDVTANGVSLGKAAGTYNTYKVTGKTEITVATAEKTKYTVSWTNPTGATITVTANETGTVTNGETVYAGQTLTVTVKASSGYRLNTVTIGGTAQSGVSTSHAGSSTFTYNNVSANTSISATTVQMYQVSWTATNATISVTSNGSSISSGTYVDTGSSLSIAVTAADYYAISGVNIDGGLVGTAAGTYTHNVTSTTTISNTAVKTHYSVEFSLSLIDSVTNVKDSEDQTYPVSNETTIWVPVDLTLTFTVKVSNSEISASADKGTLRQTNYDGDKTYDYQYTPTATNDYAKITLKGNCIVEGTLITLADGTQKPVEDLKGDELLLVWNLKTGKYDAAPIVFVDSDERMEYTVVTLYFSNGAQVGVVSEHGFFDVALGQYVYLNELNAADYIGHEFITQGSIEKNTWTTATLVNVVVEQKVVKVYSPVTFSHLCYYVDGVLSMPGGIEGLFNIFEVDVETMSYDADKMAQDIETYGLFTYEDFASIIPMEVYEAFNGAWLKVAMGKGLIDWATIENYAIRYMPLM